MIDRYQLKFSPYQRPFRQPVRTSHGIWKVREGIIIELSDFKGNIGEGEIAPLPWFGSETLKEALVYCQQLSPEISLEDIKSIPDNLPACQFAFESAWTNLNEPLNNEEESRNYSYLLPAGERALTKWREIVANSESVLTFKWKIAVEPINQEIAIFQKLIQELPINVKLRLDANGGLNLAQARQWLETTANHLDQVEFIEQPLPSSQFDLMCALQNAYPTPLALDESVANTSDLVKCYRQGWQGVFVVKPAILGYPSLLKQIARENTLDLVFSSVFETEVGRQAVLCLARELIDRQYLIRERALGFGVYF
jgi:O-succinylbenzoate synthase